jgi:hypothetical protein
MIQHTMLNFRKYADAELLAFSQSVLTRIAERAVFEPLRDFSNNDVKPAFEAYKTALSASSDGGRTLVAAKNARKVILTDNLVLLALQVQVLAKDNRELLLSSGFLPRENRFTTRRNGALGSVAGLSVETGALPGTAIITFAPVPQVRLYSVEHSTDGQTWSNSIYPSTSRFLLEGLRSKSENHIRVRALGSDMRQGPWSDPVAVYVR